MNSDIPERLDALNPDDPWPVRWKYHHIYRYHLAKRFCRGKKVIDVGCGYGYGSFILSTVSEKVVGIDISEEAIHSAKERYPKWNIDFFVMDAERMKFSDRFDVIVSFENIEHLRNPELFLAEAASLLKSDGVLIVSSPNKKYTRGDNPYHFTEYDYDGFKELLSKYFAKVKIQGQYLLKWYSLYPLRVLENRIPRLTLIPCFLGKPFPRRSSVLIAIARKPRR
jgi:2-polyprenyl-3-methyl-5-hydroxy-6-metoxy-1,4-benzoquinol methylase